MTRLNASASWAKSGRSPRHSCASEIEQGDIATARSRLVESLKLAQELDDGHRIASALEVFVQIAVLEKRATELLQLAAAGEAVRESITVPLPPAERLHLERYLALTGASVAAGNRAETRAQHMLTARERQVARLVAQGLTNRQIAERLVIAEGTAERHIGNILSKLQMKARSHIAAWLLRRDWFR